MFPNLHLSVELVDHPSFAHFSVSNILILNRLPGLPHFVSVHEKFGDGQ